MALFLSLHQAPGLSPEEIAGYGPDVAKGVYATFRQLYVNTDTGFIVSVYEADSAAADTAIPSVSDICWNVV